MKNINKTAEKYLALKQKISSLEEELLDLKNILMEHGSCETSKFVVSIEDRQRIGVVSHRELTDILGENVVVEKGLLKVSEYQQLSVQVKKVA